MTHEPQEQYDGAATLVVQDERLAVEVTLRGHFEPLDGRFHWYGRIVATDALAPRLSGTPLAIETPHGRAEAKINDIDPWGRFRISGTGTPPF